MIAIPEVVDSIPTKDIFCVRITIVLSVFNLYMINTGGFSPKIILDTENILVSFLKFNVQIPNAVKTHIPYTG